MSNTVSPPQLRPYQHDAVSRVITHFRSSDDPAVIVLPTGAGKSLVIAELARLARGRVLVLAHVRELVEQNHAKYLAYGREADIFSAGLGRKESARQVVFASVQSVINGLDAFSQGDFTLLVIDECHRVDIQPHGQSPHEHEVREPVDVSVDSSCVRDDKTAGGKSPKKKHPPSYQRVIESLRKANPSLKILGLTATPYRLGQGFIYYRHYHGMVRGSEEAFFCDCVYELPLRWMVRHGYLSEPKRIDAAVAGYDFSHLLVGPSGHFSEQEIARTAESNRATPGIIAEVVERSRDRHGVMIFAGSVDHAREIHALLPKGEAALVTGNTPSDERSHIIESFKHRELKYLVNVSVLTTGFDAPHVDVIAILRPTESVGLYQQIVGRGLRLSAGKKDCLILDYAGNPWDLYAPEVDQPRPAADTEPVQVECPQCGFANLFWGRRDGNIIIEHFGRRCQGLVENEQGQRQQCNFRFRFKNCPQCDGENDIAARRCSHCGEVLVDIDRKLKEILRLRDAKVIKVASMRLSSCHNGRGLERLKIDYLDEEGESLGAWYAFDTPAQRQAFYHAFLKEHLKAPGVSWKPASIHEVLEGGERLRAPDFVIARKVGRYWQISSRVFDYQAMGGRRQLADSAAATRVYID